MTLRKTLLVGLALMSSMAIAPVAHAQLGTLEERPFEPSPAVVKGTIAALGDRSEEVVCLAIQRLGDWRQAVAATDVEKLLAPEMAAPVRLAGFQFFVRLAAAAKPHVGAVLKHLADPDPNIRAAVLNAIHAAGASSDHRAVIAPLLEDSRSDVRIAAARCLAQAGKAAGAQRMALLEAIASTGSAAFKAEALRALAEIGGLTGAQIETILPLIRERDAEVRIGAWAAILRSVAEGRAAGTVTTEKFQAYRGQLAPVYEKEPPEIKVALFEEIRRDKTTAAAFIERILQQIREGSPESRAAALRTLGNAGEAAREHVAEILNYAKDPDSTIRAATIAALGSLGAAVVKQQLAVVANALLDPSELVRDEALQALPLAGDALNNLPFRIGDVFPTASPGVRSTLLKALPAICRVIGIDAGAQARLRAALGDAEPEMRIAAAYVMGELGPKLGAPMLSDLLALVNDKEASVRGAAVIALRPYATDPGEKQKARAVLRPLLKDKDTDVRWAVLDAFYELDPGREAAIVGEIAALLKDEDQAVRSAAVRALGAARAAARPYLVEIIRFFDDDPAVPPYAAAQCVAEIGPLSAQELTSLLYPMYVYADITPLVRLTAYGASAGENDGLLLVRLLGRTVSKDVVPEAEKGRATALLENALKAPLLHEKLRTEIQSRLAELK